MRNKVMVAPSLRPGLPPVTEKVTHSIANSVWIRVAVSFAFVSLVVLHWPDTESSSIPRNYQDYIDKSNNPVALCADPVWNDHPKSCSCVNPLVAKERGLQWWQEQHETLVSAARGVKPNEYDVVFVGDSITARLMSKRFGGGLAKNSKYLAVFNSYFNKTEGGKFDGMALGISGDTSVELLYHMKHGMISRTLNPRLWHILIGTNDLGNTECSKESTLAGILHVAETLQAARPKTPIVIHGLLPRADVFRATNWEDNYYLLGKRWQQIQWINLRLKRHCSRNSNWNFIDSGQLFISKTHGAKKIEPSLSKDALHPTAAGYQKWLSIVSESIAAILAK